MNPYILALSTVNPKHFFSQSSIAETFKKSLSLTPIEAQKLHKIFENSEIKTRYSVIPDYGYNNLKGQLFGENFPAHIPTTEQRNQIYIQEAPKLAQIACQKALKEWNQDLDIITHVISVSCTGMYAPGIELGLIESLGLKSSVERFAINFMGCFGAFKGLALARALAKENRQHRILVVCTELCSLHFQADTQIETFVSNALFGDGAACAIVGCEPLKDEKPLYEIQKHACLALKDSQDFMTWKIINTGMQMTLSAQVPKSIGLQIQSFSQNLLSDDISFDQCEWAIHPGGKAIIQAIEKACLLHPDQTQESWDILRDYGNMSSATFLFILDKMRAQQKVRQSVIGLGFGPGLSIEGILLKIVGQEICKTDQ